VYYQPADIGTQILNSFEKEINQIHKSLVEINSKYSPLLKAILSLITKEVNVK
jgi:hypothetical protein